VPVTASTILQPGLLDARFGPTLIANVPSTPNAPLEILEREVIRLRSAADKSECVLAGGSSVVLSRFLAPHVRVGSRLRFPVPQDASNERVEVHVRPTASGGFETLQVPIGHVTRPKQDKHGNSFVSAHVSRPQLGISAVHLRCGAIRDYFYIADRCSKAGGQPSLYDLLRVSPSVLPAELRLAFQITHLECKTLGDSRLAFQVERAFNILAHPNLRSCYDALLVDAEGPVLFPYAGFGTLVANGYLSPDATAFFGVRILSFLPETRKGRFAIPLRRLTFYNQYALYKDSHSSIEVLFDRVSLPLDWDPTWNQWRHLLGAQIAFEGRFTRCSKYRRGRGAEAELVKWEEALPSRLRVTLPDDVTEQINEARQKFEKLGRFAPELEQIRAYLETHAIESTELKRFCSELGLPFDFDPTLINWQPNYDSFYYRELVARSRRLHVFRHEYIFETERVLVAEIPSRGHATYLFARPAKIEEFLARYVQTTREGIRKNMNCVAEKLGFIARVIHGHNRQKWLQGLRAHLGESAPVPDLPP
jgi:hypothetical protein